MVTVAGGVTGVGRRGRIGVRWCWGASVVFGDGLGRVGCSTAMVALPAGVFETSAGGCGVAPAWLCSASATAAAAVRPASAPRSARGEARCAGGAVSGGGVVLAVLAAGVLRRRG